MKEELMPISEAELDRQFGLLEQAAKRGERCPQSGNFGPLKSAATTALARAGRIRIEIYAHNWRVVEILTGRHAGKRTMPTPYKGSGRPYMTIGTETIMTTRMNRISHAPITLARVASLEAPDLD
jgi:hypothetical protein